MTLTAKGCADTIITELAAMAVVPDGLVLREIAAETDLDTVVNQTAGEIIVTSSDIPRF